MASAHGGKSTVNSQKSAIAMMAAVATVGAGVIAVTPTQLSSLPVRVAVPVELTAAQSALQTAAVDMVTSLLTVGSTGTPAAALEPAAAANVLTSAAAISPTSIIQQIVNGAGLFLFGSGSTSLIGLSTEAAFLVNSALIAVDGRLYQVSNAIGSAVAGASSGPLAPVAGVPPVKAILAAVSTLLKNLVPSPDALESVSGGFGFQPFEIPVNLQRIVTSPINAIGLAVQAFVANLQGTAGASVAAVKNSVAAVPKTDANTTKLALTPTAATDSTKTTAETTNSRDRKSGETTKPGDGKPDQNSTPSDSTTDSATARGTNTTPDTHTKPDPTTKSDKAGKSGSKHSKSDGDKASHRGSGRHSASGKAHGNVGAHSGGRHAAK